MTEETEVQIDQPRRRVNSHTAMTRFIFSMLKPFLIVVVVAVGLLYLLRVAGI
jgi:hypothetical protein